MDKINEYKDLFLDKVVFFTPKVLIAIIILWVGLKVISRLMDYIRFTISKGGFSEEVLSFLSSLIDIGLKVVLFFIIAGVFGINIASFVAILAAAGFAIGMALQGSLANFAAGIIILATKPYKVGDWIGSEDAFGKVIDIQIFSTTLLSPGNKRIIIPNGNIINNAITNYSLQDAIRLELQVNMPYSEDFSRVKKIIAYVLAGMDQVLKDPSPEIGINAFESHSIIIDVRPFCRPDEYWEVYYKVYEKVKAAFSREGIQVAYSEGVEMGKIGN